MYTDIVRNQIVSGTTERRWKEVGCERNFPVYYMCRRHIKFVVYVNVVYYVTNPLEKTYLFIYGLISLRIISSR